LADITLKQGDFTLGDLRDFVFPSAEEAKNTWSLCKVEVPQVSV